MLIMNYMYQLVIASMSNCYLYPQKPQRLILVNNFSILLKFKLRSHHLPSFFSGARFRCALLLIYGNSIAENFPHGDGYVQEIILVVCDDLSNYSKSLLYSITAQ
jgi:hypothetical protein